MPTLQSRWERYNANPQSHVRRKAKREVASIAGPSPVYPPTAPIHGDWIGGRINGHTVVLRLMRDPKHRCDQWSAEVDGEVVADAAGLTALWQILHKQFPKAPSLKALATMRD